LYLTPPVCLLLLTLRLAGKNLTNARAWSLEFRSGWAVGAVWLGLIHLFLPLFGLDPRQDVVERRNRPAAWAISGALVGLTLCFAGAAGDALPVEGVLGGVPWGMLATLALLFLWAILERLADPSEAITVARDGGAACRLAGLLIALGLLLGRAFADLTA